MNKLTLLFGVASLAIGLVTGYILAGAGTATTPVTEAVQVERKPLL